MSHKEKLLGSPDPDIDRQNIGNFFIPEKSNSFQSREQKLL